MARPAQPSEMIGQRLALTARLVRRFIEHRLSAEDATIATVTLCQALRDDPGLVQRDLAGKVKVKGPTLVRQIDRLEAAGLVARRVDDRDRRARRVSLTPAGEAHLVRLEAIARQADLDLTTALGPEAMAALDELHERLSTEARRLLAAETDVAIRRTRRPAMPA